MIGVLIVPTGIGCEIGGHAGNANPVAKLLAKCCDKLITHPNVVNASDINEMTENTLYVEGSMLDEFLKGEVRLIETRTQNKILVAVNKPARGDTINAVSAARATISINAEIVELEKPLRMVATMEDGGASGHLEGHNDLVRQVDFLDFDALAIHTKIEVPNDVALRYYKKGGINPWGGVEAMLSKYVSKALLKPVAHAPLESVTKEDGELFDVGMEPVDPRIAPEAISLCYLHCVLKGLNRAPQITSFESHHQALSFLDVDFMVSPYGCWGIPHKACTEHKIPIITVMENMPERTIGTPQYDSNIITVKNYWEAAGVIMAMQAGIHPSSVRRPLEKTHIIN